MAPRGARRRRRARGRHQHRLAGGADRRRARRRLALRPRHPYSMEGRDHGGALETAGGIAKALPLLGDDRSGSSPPTSTRPAFASAAARTTPSSPAAASAQLWLVPNPHFHPRRRLRPRRRRPRPGRRRRPRRPALDLRQHRPAAAPRCSPASRRARSAALGAAALRRHAARRIGAEVWRGRWENVGTPEQLAALNASA